MSKKSEAKIRQDYVPKCTPQTCGNCAHLLIDLDHPAWMKDGKHDHYLRSDAYLRETNIRCGIGGFAVKKMGTCIEWGGKP